ncbi:MAG: TonB-dependent receptor [Myxococcota bacterium]
MRSASLDRRPVPFRFLLAAILMLAPWSASAQTMPTDEPAQVASVAQRMEVPIERVPGLITVIGREEIERRQLRTLPQLLNAVPGLHVVQQGGAGKQTSVFTHGTESDHTLVLLDGIEISDPSTPGTTFDLAHLLTDDVERVEILRGPLSTLYGSEAVGGVINIVLRKGRGERTVSTWGEAGGYNTTRYSVGVRGGGARLDYSLGYTNLHTRGMTAIAEDLGGRDDDGYDNRSTSARIGYQSGGAVSVDLFGRFIDTDNELDAFSDDPDARGSTRQLFVRGEGHLELLDGAWMQTFGVSYTDHDRKDNDDPFVEATRGGRRLELDWQHDLYLGRGHILTLGVETERESMDGTGAHASARTSAAFLQEQFEFGDRLFGTLGLRLDHHDEFGSELTYRVAAAYVHPGTGTKLRASIGTAFKAPSLNDLFDESFFFRGNPDLEPEKSRGWQIGLEQPLWDGRLRLGVTYFQNRIRNLIDFVVLDPVAFLFSVENIGRAKTDGFESFVALSLADRLTLRLDHTYTMAEDRETGEDLLRRPSHKLSFKAEARPTERATVSLSVVYIGHRKDFDARTFERGVSRGGYTLTDLAATYQITPRWRGFGRVENLFDREYDDPDGFESPGIVGFVGVSAKY